MNAKIFIGVIGCVGLLSGCCFSPIQGTSDFGSSSFSGCGQSSCVTTTTTCESTSSYRDTHSYCGDACNAGGCSSYFGNVGGLSYDAPGAL